MISLKLLAANTRFVVFGRKGVPPFDSNKKIAIIELVFEIWPKIYEKYLSIRKKR